MKKIILIAILSLLFISSYGTPQTADLLVYKGDTVQIYPFILEKYIWEHPDSETIHEEIRKHKDMSTGCWRGFIALFEIRKDSLFLIKAYTPYEKNNIDLSLLFDRQTDIFVNWFSDTITSPENCLISEHGLWWGGYYEYETDFMFEKGVLTGIKKYKNEIKASKMQTDPFFLKNYIQASINYENVEPPKEKILVFTRINEIKDVDDDGRIVNVTIIKGHEKYNEEAVRIIKTIPWRVMTVRGKRKGSFYTLPVIFEPQNE